MSVAAEDVFATDRPGNGNAATTVRHGDVQVEWGVNAALDKAAGRTRRTLSFPTGIRLGFLPSLELRLNGDLLAIESSDVPEEPTHVGATDLSIGLKVQLLRQQRVRPDLALLAMLATPVGDDRFSSGQAHPFFSVIGGWSLPAGFSALVTANCDLPPLSADSGVYARFSYLALIGYGLPFWDEQVSVYAEIYGVVAAVGAEPNWHQLDAGIILLITPDLQLDVNGQFGLTRDAPDVQAGIGVSYRVRSFGG